MIKISKIKIPHSYFVYGTMYSVFTAIFFFLGVMLLELQTTEMVIVGGLFTVSSGVLLNQAVQFFKRDYAEFKIKSQNTRS